MLASAEPTPRPGLSETISWFCSRLCGHYDRLVVVAPPRSLGELDTLLTPQVKKMVSHQIAKDLTGASPPDLWHALEKVLPTAALA